MNLKALVVLVLSGLLVLWMACRPPGSDGDGDVDVDSDADGDGDTDTDADTDGDWDWPTGDGCTQVDILFVIDDSGSMSEEQSNLAANFPQFIQLLEDYTTPAGTQLEYRVGVTSTSRSGLRLTGSFTTKMGGPACVPSDECPQANQTCECPGLGFVECGDDCPGNCFCEPPGSTLPMPPESCGGEDGALVTPSGYSEPWIDGPGTHVSAAFSNAASLGTGGCSLEMPLYAAEHALSTEHQSALGGANHGFLRPNALLMLILVTDEDDCSSDIDEFRFDAVIDMNHPMAGGTGDNGCTDGTGADLDDRWLTLEHYLEFFDGLVGMRSHWAVAVVAGQNSCSSSFGDAYTAHRLLRFVDMVGANAVFSDICQADLASALEDALDTLQVACDDYILI